MRRLWTAAGQRGRPADKLADQSTSQRWAARTTRNHAGLAIGRGAGVWHSLCSMADGRTNGRHPDTRRSSASADRAPIEGAMMRKQGVAALVIGLPLLAGLSAACTGAGEAEDEGWRSDDGKADGTGVKLKYKKYDVLFTNPLCREYTYPTPMMTADGSATLTAKPKNVWCSSSDSAASAARPSSPQYKLLEWIKPLGQGDEIFLAYLSFSNAAVSTELCAAANRGTKITFVLDAESTQSNALKACGATILLRGHAGSIGYAHNKVILINPKAAGPGDPDSTYMRMTFSSGNMSSGVVLHHENWHFIEVARTGYFAQAHLCLMDAQVSPTASAGKTQYKTAINSCRADIEAEEEDDIKAFFVPALDDSKRATSYMLKAVGEAKSVDIGVHRFGYPNLVTTLADKLEDDPDFSVRMVGDDDLYWLDPVSGPSAKVGSNEYFEADNIARLEEVGGDRYEMRYLETNHGQHLLHHSKYLLYRKADGKPFGLIAGAANLTKTGFTDNFENIYFIKVPKVLQAFDTQFARMWDGEPATATEQDPPVATPRNLMPESDVAGQ
jgi:hypothetical protein